MPPYLSSLLPQHSHLQDNAVDPEFVGNLGLYPTYTYTYNSSHLWRLHYEPAVVLGTLHVLSHLHKRSFTNVETEVRKFI